MTRRDAAVVSTLVNLLSVRACTYDEIVEQTGYIKTRVARWVKASRAGAGMPGGNPCVYIAGWAPDKNGRLHLPVFRWGFGKDLARPGQRYTSAERMRIARAAK